MSGDFGFVNRFSHGVSVELDAIGVVDEAVEDGVGEGGFIDNIVPGIDRKLACDEG